jgi:hypothetical protein
MYQCNNPGIEQHSNATQDPLANDSEEQYPARDSTKPPCLMLAGNKTQNYSNQSDQTG